MKLNTILKSVLLLIYLIPFTFCSTEEKTSDNPKIFASSLDTTIIAGDDFFNYALGSWIKNNPIPDSESSWGIHKEVQNEVYKRLLKICKEAELNPDNLKSKQLRNKNYPAYKFILTK